MFVYMLNSSPNINGNTYKLLEYIGKKLDEENIEYKIDNVGKAIESCKIPFCVACSSPCSKVCYEGTKLEEMFETMKKADFIVFATPVYFGTVSAQLKALFDKSRAYRAQTAFVGKPASVVTVGASKYGGQETAIKTVHDMMLVQGMTIVGAGSIEGGAHHHGVSAQSPALEDKFALSCADSLAKRIASYK